MDTVGAYLLSVSKQGAPFRGERVGYSREVVAGLGKDALC